MAYFRPSTRRRCQACSAEERKRSLACGENALMRAFSWAVRRIGSWALGACRQSA
jgi:hypothetical protein